MTILRNDVLLLGAAGNSGRLIAAELAARGLSVRLAGRRRGPLEDLARALAAGGATTDVRTVDVSDAASLAEAIRNSFSTSICCLKMVALGESTLE